jgi:hypothetical protein
VTRTATTAARLFDALRVLQFRPAWPFSLSDHERACQSEAPPCPACGHWIEVQPWSRGDLYFRIGCCMACGCAAELE